jgi:energy-coupling factor transporter ATP-binding protein EcfA2
LQRDTWFTPPDGDPWLDKEFLNMYLLMIGPAGCGKSSAINIVQKILAATMHELLEDEDGMMKRKDAAIISNMSTPEAFLSTLYQHTRGEENTRRQIMVTDSDGQPRLVKATANGIAIISEFGSLLGKQKYMEGMSTILLDLYDCPTSYKWNTVKRGSIAIPEVFYNMIGATTADSVASNVNTAILQDGFMSRTIMAHVPNFPRERSFRFKTQCSMSDLARRLIWVAKTQQGNFQLSKDAARYYHDWYGKFMKKMNSNPDQAGYMIRNRSLALKVAVILKISDYTPGRIVRIEHLKAAFKLIDYTYMEVADLINYFGNAQIGATKKAILHFVGARSSGATRRTLALNIKKYKTEVVDQALQDLWLEGKIATVDSKGDSIYGKKPEGFPAERYALVRVKHRDKSFVIEEPSGISSGSEEYVLERRASHDDSQDDEEEPLGNILSPERVWG